MPFGSSVIAQVARGFLFGLAALAALAVGFLFVLAVTFECTESQYGSDLCAEQLGWTGIASIGLVLSFIVGLAQAAWGHHYRYFFRAMLVGTVLTVAVAAVGRLVSN